MNKILLNIFILLFVVFFYSCNISDHKNIYSGNTKYITSFPDTIELVGEKIELDNIGAKSIDCVDTFLVFATSQLETFYTVYSTQTYKHLGNFIQKGRGKNEMVNIAYPIFSKEGNGEALLFLNDILKKEVKCLNITQSVNKNHTIFDEKNISIKNYLNSKYIYPINDSIYFCHIFDIEEKNDLYASYNKNTEHLKILKDVYTTSLENIGNVFLLNSYACFNPAQQKYATAMQFFNQINIYPYNSSAEAFSLIIGNEITEIKKVEKTNMPEKKEYYEDMICTDEFLFAIYADCTRKEWATSENLSVDLHVFDWNGTPQCLIKLNEQIAKIAIDKSNNILYGMTLNEEVYKYDLQTLKH